MSDPEVAFLEIFRDEANERLDSMVEVLLALEDGRAAPDAIDSLFRDAHTIKGAAAMIGLEDIRALAHAAEDVLDLAREAGTFSPGLVEPLLKTADALRTHVNGDGESFSELIEALETAKAELEHPSAVAAPHDTDVEAPGAPEPRTNGTALRGDARTIRVPAEKLDRLLDLVGETVLHRRRLEHALADPDQSGDRAADELGFGDRLLSELQNAAIETRTLPLSSITSPYARAVRDVATEDGKEAELVVVGGETELDRLILEKLSEPLVHLLRNAVAHGVETPAERERAGKPRQGRVTLGAEQRGRVVAITVADDGRGVSDDVLAEARREGSLVDVLTRAGFSTRSDVDGLAGRGVGLDVVRVHVESVGGSLEVESEPGRGTCMTLLLPLTLALLDVLLVERGPHVFGLPLASVQEAVTVTETLSLAGEETLELRGGTIQLADLVDLLGGEEPTLVPLRTALVVSSSGRRVAVLCDRLIGQEEVVVKSLGPLLASVAGYLGAAILGDGRIALLVDASSLVRAAKRRRPGSAQSTAAAAAMPKLLVVEDSFTIRELQRSVLEAAGYLVETARNGKDALERLAADSGIDLVVTDVDMPEMDGIALTSAIRAQAERASMPVIVVTSRGSPEDRQRGVDAGADAYMVKSDFDQHAFLEIVGRLVSR